MPVPPPLKVLIVDDEPLARQRLEDLLNQQPDVEIIGMVNNGRKAVEAILHSKPDLVFLDVQMPGLTGVEVVQEIGAAQMPVVIFVTAYDQYALKAFDLAALDYLVKPFDDERFEQAFERARQVLKLHEFKDLGDRLVPLLERPAEPSPPPRFLERIAVEMRGQVRVVQVRQIEYITASGAYAELHVGPQTFIIRERMQTLEERLDPEVFFRIHRSTIVRLDQIEALLYNSGGDYAVRLKDGARLGISRGRREALEQRLGLDILGEDT